MHRTRPSGLCLGLALRLALPLAAILATAGCGREPGHRSGGAGRDSTHALRQRIAAFEAARSTGGGAIARACGHLDPRVRRAAALALGRLQSPSALDALLPLLADDDSTVVDQAAFAIGQLRGLDEAQRLALQAELVPLAEGLPITRIAPLVEALGKQAGREASIAVARGLASGILAGQGSLARPPLVEGLAVIALGRIDGQVARRELADLGDMRSRTAPAVTRIAWGLSLHPDPRYREILLTMLEHPEPEARAAGARALGKLHDASVVGALTRHLADLDWEVRASVLVALAEIAGTSALPRDGLDFCAALTHDTHPLVREAAVVALDSASVRPHGALLAESLADSVPAVRSAAVRALCRAEKRARRDAWEAARRDPVEFVRADVLSVAAHALGADAALPVLLECLASPSVQERTAAASALGALRASGGAGARIRTALEAALADGDFAVAATAAEALGARGDTASVPALAAAYAARQQQRNDVDVRLAAVEAAAGLAAGARPPAAPRLDALFARAAGDPDPRVARAAALGNARLRGLPEPAAAPPAVRTDAALPDTLPAIDLGRVRVRLVTARGTATLELHGDDYPRTVGNFLQLVDRGFYRDGVFHRVVPAFVVQGGCPRGDGWGDAGSFLPCEYGDLRFETGTVGMAHAGRHTGGSQFFVTHVPVPRLDGSYTAFGKVVDGMDVVDRIVRGDRFRIEREPPAVHQ